MFRRLIWRVVEKRVGARSTRGFPPEGMIDVYWSSPIYSPTPSARFHQKLICRLNIRAINQETRSISLQGMSYSTYSNDSNLDGAAACMVIKKRRCPSRQRSIFG